VLWFENLKVFQYEIVLPAWTVILFTD